VKAPIVSAKDAGLPTLDRAERAWLPR